MKQFLEIVNSGKWQKNGGSLCGPGSDPAGAAGAKMAVEMICDSLWLKPKSVLDVACGDGGWITQTTMFTECIARGRVKYTGIDIVPENIERFRARKLPAKGVELIVGDASEMRLPPVDLVILRDLLIHLPFQDATRLIENIRQSGSGCILTTTFPMAVRNWNLSKIDGDWYPVNVVHGPFNMRPMILFFDGEIGVEKYLALCRL